MSLSYAEELRAQVEKFEQEIREAESAGKDCDGDLVALSHLKALIAHLQPSKGS